VTPRRRALLQRAGLFVLAALAAPLAITGLFWVLPPNANWPPFLILTAVAAALWFWRRPLRAAAVGLVVGAFAWGVALLWVFAQWDGIGDI
jgi:FtsH-binding integral membrane protein